MVGRGEDSFVALDQALPECEGGICRLICASNVALPDRDSPVGDVIVRRVVEVRIGRAIDVRWSDERHELMAELVCRRVTEKQQIRLEVKACDGATTDGRDRRSSQDVAGVGPMSVLPLLALLDIRVLIDYPRLERREVGRCGRWEVRGQEFFERGRARGAQRVVARIRAGDRSEVQPELREVGGDIDRLEVEAGGLIRDRRRRRRYGRQGDLYVCPFTLGERYCGGGADLAGCARHDQDSVVVGRRVVRRVVDVEVVEPVEVVGGRKGRVQNAELRLLCGAVGLRDERPAGRIRHTGDVVRVGRSPWSHRVGLAGSLIADAKGIRPGRLAGHVVIHEHATVREEGPEVDDRPGYLRHQVSGRDPFDRGDHLARPLGCLRDVIGLQDAVGRESCPVVEVPLADTEVRVVH